MKRFSKQELFNLRNNISINLLISEILQIPSKFSNGKLRFLCPICSAFNTSTTLKTNLARCFRCKINFNTIEMVMNDKNLDFVDSAKFLQGYLDVLEDSSNKIYERKPLLNPELQNSSAEQIQQECLNELSQKLSNKLSISSPDVINSNKQDPVAQRVWELEKKFNYLSKQFDQLKSFVIRDFTEKSKNII